MFFRAFLVGLGVVLLINAIRRWLSTSRVNSPPEVSDPRSIDPDLVRDADYRDLKY